MTNKELFKQAVNEGFMIRMERDAAVIEKDIICSEGHYRKLSEIFGFEVKRPNPKRIGVRRAVAAILIAAALLLAGCAAVVYKEQIGEFFTTVFETHIKGSFSEEKSPNNEAIEEYYIPTYIPEGYELVEETLGIMATRYVFEDNNGAQIIFNQAPISNIQYTIDGEHGITNILTYGQFTIYCRIIDNTGYYIWNNEKYAFSIYSDTEINEEEIIKIIDSITVKSK